MTKKQTRMSRLTTAFFIALGGMLLSDGCKKGEGDPFISLHSRTKRIAGDWVIKSAHGTDDTINWTYSNPYITYKSPKSESSEYITYNYTFDRYGNYTYIEKARFSDSTYSKSIEGRWIFGGGVDGVRSKSLLILRPGKETKINYTSTTSTSNTTTYEGDDGPSIVFYLYELRNKKIVLQKDGSTDKGTGKVKHSEEWILEQ